MQVRYGGYTHQDAEVSFSTNKLALRAQSGVAFGYVERWALRGMLIPNITLTDSAAMIADLNVQIQGLQDAYKQTGGDIELIGTGHRIRHSDTVNGIQVIQPPYFPTTENAEHVTYRTYEIVLEAEIMYRPGMPVFISYEERITMWGGGPEYVLTSPLVGTPDRLIAREQTPYMAQQRGSAVGMYTYPTPPPPIWPGALLEQNPRTDSGSSMRVGESSVSWEYLFGSGSPLGSSSAGVPNFFIPNLGFNQFAPQA